MFFHLIFDSFFFFISKERIDIHLVILASKLIEVEDLFKFVLE